jgi:hypothetical protein
VADYHRRQADDAIGYVEASDVDTAIKKAIEDFKITNVQIQKRLVAERIKGIAQKG